MPFKIVTSTTAGYTHWTLHLARNLRLLGLHRYLVVCTADHDSAAFAQAHNLSFVSPLAFRRSSPKAKDLVTMLARMNASSRFRRVFRSMGWHAAVHYKQECVWGLLRRMAFGSSILLVDGDVSLFRDPLPVLRASSGADLVFLDDRKPESKEGYVNSGFVLMRSSPASRAFARAYLSEMRLRRKANDQSVLNDVLGTGEDSDVDARHRRLNTSRALRVDVLDARLFLNGYLFYEYRRQRPLDASAAVAVHHNWIRGDRNKWERARAYDTIVETVEETSDQFLRRARHSMRVREAWLYRNASHPGNLFCGQSGPGC